MARDSCYQFSSYFRHIPYFVCVWGGGRGSVLEQFFERPYILNNMYLIKVKSEFDRSSVIECSICVSIEFAQFNFQKWKFHKTRWSCPWNSDQNCTQNSARVVRVMGI